jgi:hypothetical protein
MAEASKHLQGNESHRAPTRIFGTNSNNPEEGRIFLWTKAGWFERIESQSGDVTFNSVAQSEDELRKFVARDNPPDDMIQLGPEYRKRVSAEFTGQSASSDLEILLEIEHERKTRILTVIGISLVVLGLFIFGAGIYFRATYNPVNFNVSKVSQYKLEFSQAYSAGLSAIIDGLVMYICGAIITVFYMRQKDGYEDTNGNTNKAQSL